MNPSPGQGAHILGEQRCRLVPTGASREATTYNSSIGPGLRGSSCAVILLIKKTTRELCARTPPTPASRAAPGMPLSGVGGSPFAVDPQLSGNQATVFWRADVLPTVVPLAPAPRSFAGARPIDFGELGDVKERGRTVDTQSFVPTAGNCASGRLITGANNRWLSRCRSMTNYLFVSRQRCGYGRGLYI